MSESRSKELKRHGKKGANRGETEDGPSNFPLASTPGDDFHDEGVDTGGRVRKRKNIGEEIELQDPFVAFGSEIMVMILKQLDARSVARSRLISRGWHSIASSDEIWSRKVPSCFTCICFLICSFCVLVCLNSYVLIVLFFFCVLFFVVIDAFVLINVHS